MIYKDEIELLKCGIIEEKEGAIAIVDKKLFQSKMIDDLVDTIVLGEDPHMKRIAFWVTYQTALSSGVIPSSIQGLYSAMGKEEVKGFTVPAMNIRTLTYDIGLKKFRSKASNEIRKEYQKAYQNFLAYKGLRRKRFR